jgi:PEP-CTERM motif
MRSKALYTTAFAALLLVLGSGKIVFAAGNNDPPPAGPVILDLDGQPVPHSYTAYSTSFVATSTTSDISFAFREDPSFLELSNVAVTTGGSLTNLIQNGDFSAGPVGANQPTNWTYLNVYNSQAAGTVESGCGVGGGNCYYDGSVQAYDAITQTISTTVGNTYTINFELNDIGQLTTFSGLSTNGDTTDTGGNGIDLLVYAGNGVPVAAAAPEPSTWAMMLLGFAGVGFTAYRRKSKPVLMAV